MEFSPIILLALLGFIVNVASGLQFIGTSINLMENGREWTGIVKYNNQGGGIRYIPTDYNPKYNTALALTLASGPSNSKITLPNKQIADHSGQGFSLEQCFGKCLTTTNCDSFNYCPRDCFIIQYRKENPADKTHAHCEILSDGFDKDGRVANERVFTKYGPINYAHYVVRYRKPVQG